MRKFHRVKHQKKEKGARQYVEQRIPAARLYPGGHPGSGPKRVPSGGPGGPGESGYDRGAAS